MAPYWDAKRTVQHCQDHHKGIQAAAALLIVSGMFYIPLAAVTSAQMRRIPDLPYVVSAVQLAAGASGSFGFMIPGVVLAVANFRLDRPIELTQALNELFWLSLLMPWPTFLVQAFAFAYAILSDTRSKPLCPKPIAIFNILVPVVFIPSLSVHCFKTGALAWNGVMSLWIPAITIILQMVVDSLCIARAILFDEY